MSQLGHHIRVRLESDRLLHSSVAQRRSLVRSVYKTSAPWPILAFGAAGHHGHVVAKTDHRGAGELARRFEISLQLRHDYGSPFLRVHRTPLVDQRHLYSACMYDMRQREHHELASDPFLEATSAPDLLGARLIGAHLIPRVREHVPELHRRELLRLFGIDSLQPAAHWEHPDALLAAVLAAYTLVGLRGSSREVAEARRCLVHLAGRDLNERELAKLCDCSVRSIRRLRAAHPPPQQALRAIRLQLDLRRQIQARLENEPG
jgi:hypothetical protein